MREGWKRGSAPSPIKRNRPPSGLPRVLVQEPMHAPSAHDKGAEAPQGFGWRGINPPVGCKQARPSSKPFAASAISPGPFRGWGPESSGVHPHTKGARCSAGGHRHRIPSTASGLLAPRSFAHQGVRRPLAYRRKHLDQGNRGERDPGRNDLLAQQAVMGLQDAHTVAEGNARWGVPRGAGGLPRRRQQPAWQRETWASVRFRRPTPRA